ncbi:hypothetical protein ACHAWO_012923, partial [Cyclotella atomus]
SVNETSNETLAFGIPSPSPTLTNSSSAPTIDLNPSDYYCSDTWRTPEYSEDCGPPCPSGQNSECPDGLFCYGPSPNCVKTHKVGVGTKWCGSSFNDMASKCATECPGGTDDECPDGEICWGESPCALLDYSPLDVNASIGKLWCATSYKDLVENCPSECPSGLDEECPDGSVCFNMADEEMSCNTTGVGIREPVDSANLWCGSSWNNVLEECRAGCPEGTDEECALLGIGMICYDLTGNDLICEEAGVGVKEKGDPQTRWCGATFNDMLATCPKRCPETTECDEGQTCFEGSPCETEGVGVDVPEQDPDKMFCGTDFTDAMSCGTPCPNGDECGSGESCFAEVECLWGTQEDDQGEEALEDELGEDEEAFSASSSTVAASSTGAAESETSSSVSNMVMEVNSESLTDEDGEALEGVTTTAATTTPPATEAAAAPAESAPVEEVPAESAPAESAPAESAPAESAPAEEAPAEEAATEEEPTSNNANFFEESASDEVASSGLVVDNVRMALYGLTEMTSDHVSAWETLTASYFEGFYNDNADSSVSDVEAWFEFAALNLAASDRALRVRRRLQGSAHLITYTQRIRYTADGDVTLGDVLQAPFSDPSKRAEYIQYLQDNSDLFGDLQGVSTVFLPDLSQASSAVSEPVEAQPSSDSAAASESSPEPEPSSNAVVSPFEEEDVEYTSTETEATVSQEHSTDCTEDTYAGFFCHNSGEACPCGTCADNDVCMFVGDGTTVEVGSYMVQNSDAANSPENAAEFVQSALNGEFGSKTSSTAAPPAVESDPLPYSDAEYGPITVHGTMTLTGMDMIEVDTIYEWQYMTAVYEQNFYNLGEPIGDAVKDAIHNFATILEIVDLSYGDDAGTPATIIKFKQVFKYDSPDSMIAPSTIATRPFLNQDDRDAYIAYLKEMLPNTFGSLESSSGEDVTEDMTEEGDPNEAMNFLIKLTETFYCAESWPVDCSTAQSCKSGDSCPEGQKCYTAPMCAAGEEYSAPAASDDSDRPSSKFGDHSAGNGPVSVNGVMTLTGMSMVEVDNIHEWEDLTAIFEHEFYNQDEETVDYVQNIVNNFATALEILDLTYGDDNGTPTTVIQFKQSIKYDTSDPDLPVSTIVTQPFLTPEYRENYINYLKEMLPDSFGSLSTSSSVPDSDVEENEVLNFLVKLKETFYCSPTWPVDCENAKRCESGEGCDEGEKCYTAPMCAAQDEIAQGIVQDAEANTTVAPATTSDATTTAANAQSSSSGAATTAANSTTSASSTTAAKTTPPPPLSLDDMQFNSAALESDEGGNEVNKGEDEDTTYPEQFYCGVSWLDASDRCQTPCPNGDSSVCGTEESCFAFTSCQQKESFFCGESFEHASSTCSTPCSGLSVFECPQGQGCFQYTTCKGVNETAADSEGDEEDGPGTESFCGTSLEDAELSCATGHAIACHSGNHEQCPGGMECFDTTTCNTRDSFYCGTSWKNAAEVCGTPCSGGSSDECGEGEFCFAHTGCESSLFFCGESYDAASESCSAGTPTPCSSKSSDECADGQYCFAFVSSCANHVDNIIMGAFGDLGGFAGSDSPQQQEPSWMAGYWETKPINSSSTRRIALSLVASMFILLYVTL